MKNTSAMIYAIMVIISLGLSSCNMTNTPKGPTLPQSHSKKISVSNNRYLFDYIPNKEHLEICGNRYKLKGIWVEKYSDIYDYYNLIVESDKDLIIDMEIKVVDTLGNKSSDHIGNATIENGHGIWVMQDRLLDKYVITVTKIIDNTCSDTLVISKKPSKR